MRHQRMSRRNFLGLASLSAAGAAAGIGASTLGPFSGAKAATKEIPEWPWPYQGLDPEEVRKRGHLGYYEGA